MATEVTRSEAFELADDLGIDYNKNMKTVDLIKKIELVTGEKYKAVKEPKKETEKKSDSDTVRCIIHSNDKDNDEYEVVGSVNGETFQALIGVEVDFPKKFIPALDGAFHEEKVAELDDDGNPTGKYKTRIHKRYILERL